MAKVATLTDGFVSADDEKWTGLSAAAVTVADGVLTVTPSAGYDGISTATSFDATESAFLFELVQAAVGPEGIETWLVLDTAGGDALGWIVAGDGSLGAVERIASAPSWSEWDTWNPVTHRWLRIALAGGVATYDASPDGTTWTTLYIHTVTGTYTDVHVHAYAGNWGEGEATQDAVFDNFNLPPVISGVTSGVKLRDGGEWFDGLVHVPVAGQWEPGTVNVIGTTP